MRNRWSANDFLYIDRLQSDWKCAIGRESIGRYEELMPTVEKLRLIIHNYHKE